MDLSLVISSFIAGLLMFLAPCTLPLVPAYLGFISGVSVKELQENISEKIKRRIFFNGIFYVLGFSTIFILLGVLFGFGGSSLIQYRSVLSKWGGILVVLFGLYMIISQANFFVLFKKYKIFSFLEKERRLPLFKYLKPGSKISSFLFGTIFAFGWSPCIGPILGTILLFASQSATVATGGFLLLIFSLGLSLPFLVLAAIIGKSFEIIHRVSPYLKIISIVGGIFLIFLGILLFTDSFDKWTVLIYSRFDWFHYDRLLDYL